MLVVLDWLRVKLTRYVRESQKEAEAAAIPEEKPLQAEPDPRRPNV